MSDIEEAKPMAAKPQSTPDTSAADERNLVAETAPPDGAATDAKKNAVDNATDEPAPTDDELDGEDIGDVIGDHLAGITNLEEVNFGSSSFETAVEGTDDEDATTPLPQIPVLSEKTKATPPKADPKQMLRPSALKMYSSPFHSYFNSLLREEDGQSVEDSLQYSPSTYDVSVWKEGTEDDISSIGGSTLASARAAKQAPRAPDEPPLQGSSSTDTDVSNTSSDEPTDPKAKILQALKRSSRNNVAQSSDGGKRVSLMWKALALSWVFIGVLVVLVVILIIRMGQ